MLSLPMLLTSNQEATFHFVLMGVKMCFAYFSNHGSFYFEKFYFFPEKVLASVQGSIFSAADKFLAKVFNYLAHSANI
jgi:hypothetical protein